MGFHSHNGGVHWKQTRGRHSLDHFAKLLHALVSEPGCGGRWELATL